MVKRRYGGNKFGRKKKRYRKTPWYERKYNATQLAHKAYKGVMYLKGLVNSEMFHLVTASNTTVSNTGTVIHCTAIGQGDNITSRQGNSIFLRNILCRVTLEQNSSATSTFYRVILFQDTQQVGDASPTVSDVLNTVSTLSSLSLAQPGRFNILKNWFVETNNGQGTSKALEWYDGNIYSHVKYNGSASSDIQQNGLYLLLLSDQSTNTPTVTYNIKVGYHDN